MTISIISRSTIGSNGKHYGNGSILELEESEVLRIEKYGREISRVLCERVSIPSATAAIAPPPPPPVKVTEETPAIPAKAMPEPTAKTTASKNKKAPIKNIGAEGSYL